MNLFAQYSKQKSVKAKRDSKTSNHDQQKISIEAENEVNVAELLKLNDQTK